MSNEFEQNQNNEEIPSMEEILAESVEVKIGDTVTGEVLSIDDNQVIVGIEGAGVEGVIPFKELSAQPIDSIEEVAKVGDTLELVVIKQINTTATSVSLSWGAREVGSPCEWRGVARHSSRVMVGEPGLETC